MILNDKIATQIGDTIVFQTVLMLNIQQINSFADTIVGTTADRYFTKQFCYSLDGGVTLSDWFIFDNTTLQAQLNDKLATNWHELVLILKYKRDGIDNTGQLELDSITINGVYVERALGFTIGNRSIYKDLVYDNIDVLNLVVNLSQKMYTTGIVPAYLERNEDTNSVLGDEDYVDFWQLMAKFFSVIFIDAIKFENIYWKRDLLCEYLRQRNIFFCNCDDIIELQNIAQNYFDEIRQRGTEEVFHPQGYEYPIGYRTSYQMPTGYQMRPAYPVSIDGISYTEIDTLPFGWTVQGEQLIGPEKNYHQVLFFNDITNAFDILPILKFTLLPTDSSGILKRYNGEYLRLICFNQQCDEYIYNNVPTKYIGWCLGSSSPLYRGLRPQRNKTLLKAYEKQADVISLDKYPLINSNNIYIGITSTPESPNGTVLYISSDNAPCFADVLPKLKNVSTHLTVRVRYKALNSVSGILNVTNLNTLDTFEIPLFLTGDGSEIAIDTDLTPANYSVGFDLTFNNKLGGILYAGSLQYPIAASNVFSQIFTLDAVEDPTINVELNFSKTGTPPPAAVIVNQISGDPSGSNPNTMLQINNLTPINNCFSPSPGIDFHDIDLVNPALACTYSFKLPKNKTNFYDDYNIIGNDCFVQSISPVLVGNVWTVTIVVDSITAITCFVTVVVKGAYFTYAFAGAGNVGDLFIVDVNTVNLITSSVNVNGFFAVDSLASVKSKVSRTAGDCRLHIVKTTTGIDIIDLTQAITVEHTFTIIDNTGYSISGNLL